MKPPILYFGAKGTIAERIVDLMPAHEGYIEPYAGSLAVLLAKTPTKLDVVNDLDRELITFWRVLRDRPDDLTRACALTPHSREDFEDARRRENLDEVEVARRVWIRLTQGRSGTLQDVRVGWRHFSGAGVGTTHSPFSTFMDAYRDRLGPAAARLHGVSLECRDALDVISEYGAAPTSLLYVDPPYVGTTRKGSRYRHEMTDEPAHRAMAEALHACRSIVMVSGYASDLYDLELFPDWERVEINTRTANASGDTAGRIEVVWSNRPLNHGQLDLGMLA